MDPRAGSQPGDKHSLGKPAAHKRVVHLDKHRALLGKALPDMPPPDKPPARLGKVHPDNYPVHLDKRPGPPHKRPALPYRHPVR
jgi:hypothetical protein